MENNKLIEERIKIDKVNKDGKVFERGKNIVFYHVIRISVKDISNKLDFQTSN